MNVRGIAFTLCIVGAAATGASARDPLTVEQLAGVWTLTGGVWHDAVSNKDTPLTHMTGFVTYAPMGKQARMSVVWATGERPATGPKPSDAEALQLFKTFAAYTGVVEIGATVTAEGTEVINTVDLSLYPHLQGRQLRIYRIDGATLTVIGMAPNGSTNTTIWEKAAKP